MAKVLYFTRHGKTPYNAGIRDGVVVDGSPIVQSYSDGPENQLMPEKRYIELQKGILLADSGIVQIAHSGLGRSEESAILIRQQITPTPQLVNNPAFRDMSFGYLDSWSLNELTTGEHAEDVLGWIAAEKEGNLDYRLGHAPELFPTREAFERAVPPETIAEVVTRAGRAVDALDVDSLVVSHGHATKAMLWHVSQDSDFSLPKKELRTIATPNEALYRVTLGKELLVEHYDYDSQEWLEGFARENLY